MTDDDRTLDADDDMLDELRRLAAESKASVGASQTDTDVTIDADDSAMEELRRFAAEARGSQDATAESADDMGSATKNGDSPSSSAPPTAGLKESETIPLGDIPDLDLPPQRISRSRPDAAVPEVESIAPPAESPAQSGADSTQLRNGASDPIAAPSSVMQGGGWRPPPRMVMPTEPDKQSPAHAGPWKLVALGLGAVVLVLLVVVVLGMLGGDDAPTDDEVPTSDVTDVSAVVDEPEGAELDD